MRQRNGVLDDIPFLLSILDGGGSSQLLFCVHSWLEIALFAVGLDLIHQRGDLLECVSLRCSVVNSSGA